MSHKMSDDIILKGLPPRMSDQVVPEKMPDQVSEVMLNTKSLVR